MPADYEIRQSLMLEKLPRAKKLLLIYKALLRIFLIEKERGEEGSKGRRD